MNLEVQTKLSFMGKIISRLTTLILLTLLFADIISAQDIHSKQSLSETLAILESKYEIKFNYAEDIIAQVEVFLPDDSKSLADTLEILENQTPLTFKFLGQNIILITPDKQPLFCGTIRDKSSLEPIANAVITGVGNSLISNENGFFQLSDIYLNETIIISCLGYKTETMIASSFSEDGCRDIFLEQDFQTLSEIVISNYLISGINRINDGSFEIDFSNFKILPGLTDTDVLHSVQALPGIQSTNETVSNINIRGGSHDQNLILWDNIKMYQSGHFFGLISMYNPQITQNVFLRKNGSSAALTDGVSGTIEMRTEKKINSNFKGSLGINLTNLNGFLDMPLGNKSSIQIAARKSINDFIKTPTYTAFFDRISQNTELSTNTTTEGNTNKNFDFYDTSFRWIYNIGEKDQLQVNFIYAHNELMFDENLIENQIIESRGSSLVQHSIAEGLHYNRIWNDRFKTTLEFYESDYDLKAINVNIQDNQRFLQKNTVSESSIKVKSFYKVSSKLHWLNGYHFVETEVTNLDDVDNPLYRNLRSEVIRSHGVFTELNYRSLNKKTVLNAGLRFNYIGKFNKDIWEPRLSFNQKFLDGFTFEVLGEFKHQNTSQIINFQNDFLGIEKRRWQLANNVDIPIIRGKQISAGITYNKRGWLLNADTYFKRIKGITSQSQGFQNQYEFVKTHGNYSAYGMDFLLRKQIKQLSMWFSYSYMDNTYQFKTLQKESFPSNYHITHNVNVGTSYAINHLKLSTGLQWRTGRPATIPVEGNEIVDNEVNFDHPNRSALQDYLRIDLSATYNFKLTEGTKIHTGVSVWNLLNRKNELNDFYSIKEDMPIQTLQFSLGITPNAFLRIDF